MTLALAVLGSIPDMGAWLVVLAFAVYAFSRGTGKPAVAIPKRTVPYRHSRVCRRGDYVLSRIGTIVSTWALPVFITKYGISNVMLMGAGISLIGLLVSIAFARNARSDAGANQSNDDSQ